MKENTGRRMRKPEMQDIYPSDVSGFIATTLAFLFFFEFVRELLGAIYNMNLATMSINVSLAAILAFFSPALYLFKKNVVSPPRIIGISGSIYALCRIVLALNPPLIGYLLAAFCGVASFGIFLPALIFQISKSPPQSFPAAMNPLVIYGAITGFAFDVFFRTAGNTFDITVYGFTSNRLTALLCVGPLVALFYGALVVWHRNLPSPHVRSAPVSQGGASSRLVWSGISLGALGFLYLSIIADPNTISRWVAGSFSLSVLLNAVALGGFLIGSSLPQGRRIIFDSRSSVIGGIIFLIAFLFLIYSSQPLVTTVFMALSLFMIPILVLCHLRNAGVPQMPLQRIGAFFTVTAITLVVLLIGSVFTLTYSYVPGMGILRNQMGTILMIAVVIVLLSALTSWISSPHFTLPQNHSLPGYILIPTGLLLIAGISIGAMMYPEPHPPYQEDDSLILMTYNIHQGYNTEGKINPWEILEPLDKIHPHIIALQESDMNRVTSTHVDMVRWLSHKLDMYVYFGPQTKHQIYGVALLSKFPFTATEVYFLHSIEDQRVLIRGDIEYEGKMLSVYAVHMGLSEEDRTVQTAQILDILSRNPNDKILMGDLNSLPGSKQMETFLAYFCDAWTAVGHSPHDPSGYTFDSLNPYGHIDYILLPLEWESRVKSCAVLSEVFGSDHLPIWAEII